MKKFDPTKIIHLGTTKLPEGINQIVLKKITQAEKDIIEKKSTHS